MDHQIVQQYLTGQWVFLTPLKMTVHLILLSHADPCHRVLMSLQTVSQVTHSCNYNVNHIWTIRNTVNTDYSLCCEFLFSSQLHALQNVASKAQYRICLIKSWYVVQFKFLIWLLTLVTPDHVNKILHSEQIFIVPNHSNLKYALQNLAELRPTYRLKNVQVTPNHLPTNTT